LQLTDANWSAILGAINTAGKFISLDLAACTKTTVSGGDGLRSTGDFDPVYSTDTGKDKIVNLTLPTQATGIVAGTSSDPTFENFTALKTINGAGVTSIGNSAFYYCTALTSISFPQAASIGSEAFACCTALTSVSILQAATIGEGAFADCDALTSVTMSKSLSLENFNNACFGGGNNKIVWTLAGPTGDWTTEEDGKKLIHGGNTLAYYHTASGAFTLPDTITSIGSYAFSHCTALTSVSAPQAASIGSFAFNDCTALATVTLGATPPTLGYYIFANINTARTVTVRIPDTAKNAYGIPNLPTTNFDNTSTTDSWGRAFKGTGWDTGNSDWSSNSYYGTGAVNDNITLVFETY
jgi:hypothetical protein